MARKEPNIIITGTPGVGKTSHCEELGRRLGLKHLSINQVVKQRSCHEGWDSDHESYTVDEDKLLDSLEIEVPQGGYIIDWHACDLFPESWIDLVVVLRTTSDRLYDRLRARKYSEEKLQENLDSEIMEVLLEEARESYNAGIVIELRSDEAEDIDANNERLEAWVEAWKKDRLVENQDDD